MLDRRRKVFKKDCPSTLNAPDPDKENQKFQFSGFVKIGEDLQVPTHCCTYLDVDELVSGTHYVANQLAAAHHCLIEQFRCCRRDS